MDNGVDARTRLSTSIGIGDVEANDLVVRARCIGKRVGAQIGQAKAVALAVRLPEGGADATGGAGEQHEAGIRLTHAHLGALAGIMPYVSTTHFA